MNIKEEFILMEFWSKKLRDDLRSFYRTIYFGPPIFILLNVIFCFALQKGTKIEFWTLYIPITMLSTIYCILMPRKAIKRYNNIVQAFEFKSETEMKLVLVGGDILILLKPEFKTDVFKIDNGEKVCKLVFSYSDKSNYIIIPDFFPNPLSVVSKLRTTMPVVSDYPPAPSASPPCKP